MTETEGKLKVDRVIDAPAKEIFKLLSNPANHAELDGSGMVQSDEKTDRITAVGQVFTMNMFWDKLGGEYQAENHVVGFDRTSCWRGRQPRRARIRPAGNGSGNWMRPRRIPRMSR